MWICSKVLEHVIAHYLHPFIICVTVSTQCSVCTVAGMFTFMRDRNAKRVVVVRDDCGSDALL